MEISLMVVACVNGIKKVVLCLRFFGSLVIKEVQSLKSGLLLSFSLSSSIHWSCAFQRGIC